MKLAGVTWTARDLVIMGLILAVISVTLELGQLAATLHPGVEQRRFGIRMRA